MHLAIRTLQPEDHPLNRLFPATLCAQPIQEQTDNLTPSLLPYS
jgi:hypothetical protein